MSIKEIYVKLTEMKRAVTWHYGKLTGCKRSLSNIDNQMRKIVGAQPWRQQEFDGKIQRLVDQIKYHENAITIKIREIKEFLNTTNL